MTEQIELLRISVDGGKYTVVQPRHEQVRIERHGERWLGPGFPGSNAVLALGYELEEAREKLATITAAARKLYLSGRWTAGLPAPLEARMWEDLRDALGIRVGTATAAGVHDPFAHRDGSRECRPVAEPHGCPACDDAIECSCEPPLPMFDEPTAEDRERAEAMLKAALTRPGVEL